jgi:hypothetical protein
MKLRDSGKQHQVGNPRCTVCEQQGPDGERLSSSVRRYPYVDSSGNPPCGGLVHSETFGDERTGWETLYRCDLCMAFH